MMTTRRSRIALAVAAAAALTLGAAGAAQATPPGSPAIPLNTGQEVPAPTIGGAHGWFSYDIDGNELCYTLEVTGLSSPAAAAHIHVGARNVPGPVVVPLMVENETSFEVSTCTTADAALLAAIEANPGDYYVNVHNANNQPGEIRGQLK
ncbi:CHRD domain-containing protein [Agromyces bauzanensis]|nr:CHRD domain-containing protein [Agromyces bauzanensis]